MCWNLPSSPLSNYTPLTKVINGLLAIKPVALLLLTLIFMNMCLLLEATFPLASMTPLPSSGFSSLAANPSASVRISCYPAHQPSVPQMFPTYVNHKYAGRLPRTVSREGVEGVCGERHMNEELGDAQRGPMVRICHGPCLWGRPRKGGEERKRRKRKGRKPMVSSPNFN